MTDMVIADLLSSSGAGYTIVPTVPGCFLVTFSTAEAGGLVAVQMNRQQLRDFMGLCLDVLAGPVS